jgi:hypothetical protein
MSAKPATVLQMAGTAKIAAGEGQCIEVIDSTELAKRWTVPPSWIRAHCQPRTAIADRIPHLKLGRYIRFRWNSPELNAWIASRMAL